MTDAVQSLPTDIESAQERTTQASVLKHWASFVFVGILLYLGIYAVSEALVYRYAAQNRFFQVLTAPQQSYDFVILGASHAMPLGFSDMNTRLEQAIGGKVMNLSMEGAGILPNQVAIDYFFTKHRAKNIVFFLDSFAFYSPKWNEDRINDVGLFQRAPFDPDLVRVLSRYPAARPVMLNYASGFLKINNQDRFKPDISDAEATKFTRTYRPIPQIDRRRVEYLYPREIDPGEFERYLAKFGSLIDGVRRNGGEMIVVKPPTPMRYRERLPNEAEFDSAVRGVLIARGVPLYDLSTSVTEDRYFYDTDHLNRDGVTRFIEGSLSKLLRQHL